MTETETIVGTATLARPRPVEVAYATGSAFGDYGDAALAPIGDGRLVVFTVEQRCAGEGEDGPPCPTGSKPHDVIAATIWRVPGHTPCPADSVVRRCARVAKADGELTVLAVDAGRIAARTDRSVRLLTAGGGRLREVPVEGVRAAALSGNRLALRVQGGVSVYDTGSGELVFREEGGNRLEDLRAASLSPPEGRRSRCAGSRAAALSRSRPAASLTRSSSLRGCSLPAGTA
jgi:hypothetical protein